MLVRHIVEVKYLGNNTPMRLTKKQIIIGILVVLVLSIYPIAALIRGFIIPVYAHLFYKDVVNNSYNESFSAVNQDFSELGFNIVQSEATCLINNGSGYAIYQKFRESVPCAKLAFSDYFVITEEFKNNWRQKSPAIHEQLISQGWQNTEKNFDLSKLYDQNAYEGTNEIIYDKQTKDSICRLSFEYSLYSVETNVVDDRASINQSCRRSVQFFGGYQY